MTGVKISALPAASVANDADQIEVNQSGVSRRLTVDQISERVAASDWIQDAIDDVAGLLNVRSFGAVGDGVTDDTAALRAAAVSGLPLYMPPGDYYITDTITFAGNQKITGAGRTKTYFKVDAAFNMAAVGMVTVGQVHSTAVSGATLTDVGFKCFQPPGAVVRGDLIQYPPCIFGANINRAILERIRIEAAWDGIDMNGNSGGWFMDTLEIGAFNIGIEIDGILDFVHIGRVEFWPYGFSPQPTLVAIYQDGVTIGMKLTVAGSLHVGRLAAFNAKIEVTSGANSIPMQFDAIALDGNNAMLTVAGGAVNVGSLYSTKDATASIIVTGGTAIISQIEIHSSFPGIDVAVSGGVLSILGGRHTCTNAATTCAKVTGGILRYANVSVEPTSNQARTQPMLWMTGGALQARNNGVRNGNGTGSGNFIQVDVDGALNHIEGNDNSAWTYAAPFLTSSGYYDFGSWATDIVATPSFVTNGDYAPTITLTNGKYWRRGSFVVFDLVVNFNNNAYTTASGSFNVGTNLPSALRSVSVTLNTLTNATFTAMVLAAIASGTGNLNIRSCTTGAGQTSFGVTNLPASRSSISLGFGGIYPVRQVG